MGDIVMGGILAFAGLMVVREVMVSENTTETDVTIPPTLASPVNYPSSHHHPPITFTMTIRIINLRTWGVSQYGEL